MVKRCIFCYVLLDNQRTFGFEPCSSRREDPEPRRCRHLHWCSSWPWWQLSVGSPGRISRLHPLWWSDAGLRSLAHSGGPGQRACCGSREERDSCCDFSLIKPSTWHESFKTLPHRESSWIHYKIIDIIYTVYKYIVLTWAESWSHRLTLCDSLMPSLKNHCLVSNRQTGYQTGMNPESETCCSGFFFRDWATNLDNRTTTASQLKRCSTGSSSATTLFGVAHWLWRLPRVTHVAMLHSCVLQQPLFFGEEPVCVG